MKIFLPNSDVSAEVIKLIIYCYLLFYYKIWRRICGSENEDKNTLKFSLHSTTDWQDDRPAIDVFTLCIYTYIGNLFYESNDVCSPCIFGYSEGLRAKRDKNKILSQVHLIRYPQACVWPGAINLNWVHNNVQRL